MRIFYILLFLVPVSYATMYTSVCTEIMDRLTDNKFKFYEHHLEPLFKVINNIPVQSEKDLVLANLKKQIDEKIDQYLLGRTKSYGDSIKFDLTLASVSTTLLIAGVLSLLSGEHSLKNFDSYSYDRYALKKRHSAIDRDSEFVAMCFLTAIFAYSKTLYDAYSWLKDRQSKEMAPYHKRLCFIQQKIVELQNKKQTDRVNL